MVVDIASREVRAVAGSANRASAGGWIDLTNRPRSPGSTLKPFIYGMAFDDGVASPNTRIADAPRRFATYRPDNFDRTFRGDVTVAQALQHSLNVPAVAALDEVGAQRFAAALSFAGADLSMPLTADEDAGLAIALGGAGLTVRDVALLYAALGDNGRALPLHWLKSESEAALTKKEQATQIMSAQSARQIVDILGVGARAWRPDAGAVDAGSAGDRVQDRHVLRLSAMRGRRARAVTMQSWSGSGTRTHRRARASPAATRRCLCCSTSMTRSTRITPKRSSGPPLREEIAGGACPAVCAGPVRAAECAAADSLPPGWRGGVEGRRARRRSFWRPKGGASWPGMSMASRSRGTWRVTPCGGRTMQGFMNSSWWTSMAARPSRACGS